MNQRATVAASILMNAIAYHRIRMDDRIQESIQLVLSLWT